MSLPELLELAGALVLVVSLGLLAGVLLPALAWPVALGVIGVGLLVVAFVIERAGRGAQ